ncbi:hypothetical protein PsYK624_111540 [Phanerochaete sordida]|uniref:Hydrophobin n=1 Tax=Phanerochaete sordida TaxID=48140 RepID=A0A9P3LIA7_9APHY|nr:hypothetical protein PsYK624_111540 [Phanerochaete sordida]
MKLATLTVLVVLPTALGVQFSPSAASPLTETLAVPAHIPCCEDLPTLTSLGLLSQSVLRRSKQGPRSRLSDGPRLFCVIEEGWLRRIMGYGAKTRRCCMVDGCWPRDG